MANNGSLLSYSTLSFLFLNVLAALLLHATRLPVWLIVFSIATLIWRMVVFSGRVPKPNWLLKLVLVSAGFVGVYVSYGFSPNIESMVSLLIAGVMLKPLEVEKQSDSYLLIFLNYFLCALLFLFDRSPLDFLLVIAVMLMTLTSQVLIHFYDQPDRWQSFKVGFGILIKSLPLALVLFLILPRLGPLWILNTPTQAGVVGLSDSMSPGSIAELGENSELAFRVKILEGELPMNQRYWRAFTLNEFDGNSWQRAQTFDDAVNFDTYLNDTASIRFDVLLEPHEKTWLFNLGSAQPLTEGITVHTDGSFSSNRKIYSQWQYQVAAKASEILPHTSLSNYQRQQSTRIPSGTNPKTQAFANALWQESGELGVFIAALRNFILQEQFSYTLSPGSYSGADQIDDFLFNSKTGFCSYYAGALAFMLRSVNVPARIVLGYMGGEDNDVSGTLSVFQYDAHAWVEVYIEGRGWLRIDPTGWVSPERVELGLSSAVPDQFVGFNSQSEWLRSLRQQWQAFDYYWNDWMLSYKGEKQQSLLDEIWGDKTAQELAYILMGLLLVLISALFLFLWWDQKGNKKSNEQRVVIELLNWLSNYDKKNKKDVTFMSVINQLIQLNPQVEESLREMNIKLHAILYKDSVGTLTKRETDKILADIKRIKKMSEK